MAELTFQVETEGRNLFLAWRERHGSKRGVTLRIPRSQAATLAATIANACSDTGLESFEGALFGDLVITP